MNVVLVNLDGLRRDHVGAYGNRWIKTLTLDALARDSLRFTRAYPESVPTICAKRSIYTGIRTWPWFLQGAVVGPLRPRLGLAGYCRVDRSYYLHAEGRSSPGRSMRLTS